MAHVLATSSGDIELPGGIPWVDEFKWSPVAQAISTTLGGSMIFETANVTAGRPLTLQGNPQTGWIDGDTMDALAAAEAAQGDTPFTITLQDGREFSVLFFGGGTAPAVDGTLIAIDTDNGMVGGVTPFTLEERSNARYWVVVRMIVVG